MNLPTPPTTSHREEKENRAVDAGARNVAWSKQNQFHSLSTPAKGPSCSSARRMLPAKSILKPSQPLLPLPDLKTREETPAPSTPLNDFQYLQHPISHIVSPDSTITDLIRAYSALTARIRPYVTEETDSTVPLFEPLRANRDALGTSICRDLKRALEDPIGNVDVEEEEKLQKEHKLPSPTKSPKKKKKRGMTAEQAKYARDLCTITHAVLKFLGLVLSLPIHRIFTDQQLTQILGGIIDIPMCPELPTPNGRKTYALAICVIQSLCLPANVLSPVSDSIAYVLGRGIDGELGKEGKKGSASDGFKAIHDLALHNPPVFVPAFRHLLDSILHNILSPSLNLRIQATHALGGLAYASTTLPISQVHKDLSTWVVEYLLASPKRVSPSKKSGSPTPATQESDICRTLRTTLNVEDPVHVTHGPVWALHVLGSFIVLLGSAFRTDVRVCRAISSLLILTLRHKKVSVRKLACVVWRMVVWSWHQYILPSPADGDGGPKRPAASQSQWGLIETVLTWGVGVGTCYAIVGSELGSVELVRLDRIFTLMVNKNEEARNDVLQCIIQLVDFERQQQKQKQEQVDWELDKLLSPSFMSGMGDILAVEFQDLSRSVSIIRTELPDVRDLRGLTREELVELGTMGLFLDQWSSAISMRNGQHNNEDLLLETWDAMLKTVMTLAEAGGEDAEATAMQKLVAALYDSLRTSPEERRSSDSKSDRSSTQEQFDLAKSLRVVRRAWISLSQVGPARQLEDYASQLLARLIEFEDELGEMQVDVREEWAGLCVELVLASADAMDSLSLFWKNVDSTWSWSADVQSVVWTKFVQVWQESRQDNWDAAIVLISAPFCGQNAWNLSDDELSTWERFLTFIVNQGCDNGCDAVTIMDTIARRLQRKCNPTFTCLVRIADMLMSHLETQFMEITALPENVVDFIADSLNQSYPPAPSTGLFASWMMRSLGRLINVCPDALYLDFIDSLQDSLILWITDESSAATECYDDIVTCYENLLLRLVDVHPEAEQYMGRFAPILNAMFNGPSKAVSAYDAFDVFWHTTHTVFEAMDICLWPVKIREYIYGTPAESSSSSAPATSQKESGVREEAEEQEDFDSEITSTEASIGGSSSASALALVPTPGLFSIRFSFT
ncbi:hypothetical protein D9757_008473 [Collybiopsis confluens]|uniref:Uncharacterized protein n=1 Tax=Collybiopsis confluens TaxID=2823264 RepID=A0A8H5HFM6_9AGAR|nr:hypothetical protein D9757_008473 [Collybiopsis confluens]